MVHEVIPVPDDFHARFGARRREYTYFIHRQKDPFVAPWSWQCGYPALDFDAMNEACQYLLGTHDFSCFEKTGTEGPADRRDGWKLASNPALMAVGGAGGSEATGVPRTCASCL